MIIYHPQFAISFETVKLDKIQTQIFAFCKNMIRLRNIYTDQNFLLG